jgi:NAD(P)-dependent dehydrogenase (short-subunit alcohol dehydrogenase family)
VALNPPLGDWRGTRCWILGASAGIGEALALRLAERGARVAISARRREMLDDLAMRLAPAAVSGDRRALVLPLDIRDAPSVALAADTIVREWGGLDCAIVMAGDYKPMRAWELELDAARAMVETNLMGCFHALAPVIPMMARQGRGTIALVSSVAGYRGLPKSLVYGPTKAAIINLAETLYLDLSPKGIGVCVVNPGFVKTPLTDRNEFRMPALISADEAAIEIVAGLERGDFEIHFPRRFTRAMKLLRHLPYSLYFPAIRRMTGL